MTLGLFWREFRRNTVAVAALAVVLLAITGALLAPLLAPQNPYDLASIDLSDARRPPGSVGSEGQVYLLGTDAQGRDLFSAILYGLRISIGIALLAGTVAVLIGSTLGLLAAFLRGISEAAIMRLVDLQLSVPAILMSMVLLAMFGPGQLQLVCALALAQYAYFARTMHGAASVERSKAYVEAALATPLPARRVVLRHILPNCLPPLIVVATMQIASAIGLEATLSFLGLGLPPTEPSLGTLIANGYQFLLSGRYWISIYPGIALITLIVSVNLVGDQVRDQLNPRLQR